MIKIEVDEAYAYDMLSILLVKARLAYTDLNAQNYVNLNSQLFKQILIHKTIVSSEEYQKLYDVNRSIFEYLDEMKKNPSIEDGVWVDKMNYERYLAKKVLQEKFFPEQKITEQKIGY